MSYRVSVAGIDGAGKSTTISRLVDSLSSEYTVAKLGRPIYLARNKEREYLFVSTTRLLDRLHSLADRLSLKKGVLLANAVNVTLQPTLEKRVIDIYSPDIIIASRDMTVCPAVYLTYYFRSSKKVSTELRLRIFDSFRRLGYPDILFYMDVDPNVAERRISQRIQSESNGAPTDRSKWRHMHENGKDLYELRKYYQECMNILEREGIKVIHIPTTNISSDQVVEQIQSALTLELSP